MNQPTNPTAFQLEPEQLANIPLKLIEPDPQQPRKNFDLVYIDELAASIKASGLIQPIVVSAHPDKPGRYIIVAGENRWRASKQAKTKTITAILREVDGLDRLLIQLKENHQRRDLNAIEWAIALRVMHKTHGLKQTDIANTLRTTGVANFDRAYVSNMMRLLNLPDWAQALISSGQITPAHGKALLTALPSQQVINLLAESYADLEYRPTTDLLARHIWRHFCDRHLALENWRTKFDAAEQCKGCSTKTSIAGEPFCLNTPCHALKNDAWETEQKALQETGQQARPEQPKTVVADEHNRVDVAAQNLRLWRDFRHLKDTAFDINTCSGCQRRHIHQSKEGDNDTCFDIPCLGQKEAAHQRAKKFLQKHLVRLATAIYGSEKTAHGFLSWVAVSGPVGIEGTGKDKSLIDSNLAHWVLRCRLEKPLIEQQLTTPTAFLAADSDALQQIVRQIIPELGLDDLYHLIKHTKPDINQFRIDDHYLAELTQPELAALTDSLYSHGYSPEEAQAALKADSLIQADAGQLTEFLLSKADQITAAPPEVRHAYNLLVAKHKK